MLNHKADTHSDKKLTFNITPENYAKFVSFVLNNYVKCPICHHSGGNCDHCDNFGFLQNEKLSLETLANN